MARHDHFSLPPRQQPPHAFGRAAVIEHLPPEVQGAYAEVQRRGGDAAEHAVLQAVWAFYTRRRARGIESRVLRADGTWAD